MSGLALGGCQSVLGIGDGQPAEGGAGAGAGKSTAAEGGAGTAGVGAAGGGAGAAGGDPQHAADWTAQLGAVYLFENAANLGVDATGNRHLSNLDVDATSLDPMEGELAARFTTMDPPGDSMTAPSATFWEEQAFTFGAWVRPTKGPQTGHVFDYWHEGKGYQLVVEPTWQATCQAGTRTATGSETVLDVDVWTHLACVVTAGGVTLFVGGEPVASEGAEPITHATGQPVQLGAGTLDADLDEVFFVGSALTEPAVRRIHACGVRGVGCLCDDTSPTTYSNCGRAEDCSLLTECAEPAP